ncbi:hypothetical protein [Methanosarcina sp.]
MQCAGYVLPNFGIEKIIVDVFASPNINCLFVCGKRPPGRPVA